MHHLPQFTDPPKGFSHPNPPSSHILQGLSPIRPTGTPVRMRGGGRTPKQKAEKEYQDAVEKEPQPRKSPSRGQEQSQNQSPIKHQKERHYYVHGYRGKLYVDNNSEDILDKALQLLELDLETDWKFSLDILPENSDFSYTTVNMTPNTFKSLFQRDVEPFLWADKNWRLFVRTCNIRPTILEPDPSAKNIVRIKSEKGVAYWKLPESPLLEYGINQLQDQFFIALKTLFGPERPRGNVIIGNENRQEDIGYGGMELSPGLWELVKKDIKEEKSLEYSFHIENHGGLDDVGIRLVGSDRSGQAPASNYHKIQHEILQMTRNFTTSGVQGTGIPENYMVWKTAEAREMIQDGNSNGLIPYFPEKDGVAQLKTFLEDERRRPGNTSCIWFRPFRPWIYVINADTPDKSVQFGASSPSIGRFRRSLAKLFGLSVQEYTGAFEIYEPYSNLRFIVSENAMGRDFQKDVFDWIRSSSIHVRRIDGLPCSKYLRVHRLSIFANCQNSC